MERNEAAHQSQYDMAPYVDIFALLGYYDKPSYQFWSNLFEYVYGQMVEEMVRCQHWTWNLMEDDPGAP